MSVRSFFALVDLGLAVGGAVVDGVRWVQRKIAPEESGTGPLPRRNEDSIREQIRHATMRPPPPSPSPMEASDGAADSERDGATVKPSRNR